MKKILLLLLISCITALSSIADGYKIEFKINGLKNDTVLLGYYYVDKKYVQDTVVTDAKGQCSFEGDEALEGGIYIAVLPSKTYFEFLVSEDQIFSIETDTSDFVKNMKIKGSEDNTQFNDYQRFIASIQGEATDLQTRLKANKENADSTKILREKLTTIGKQREDFISDFGIKHPGSLLANILSALIDPVVPEAPKDENGVITDSTFQYRYYKEHYFDNIDLTDPRLLRTPFLYPKVDRFFTKVVHPSPDSINAAADKVISLTCGNKELYRYYVVYFLNMYNKTKIMGMDAVYVHIAKNYYLRADCDTADWVDSTFIADMTERVGKIQGNLIGMEAKNIKLYTNEFRPYALHDVEAEYTILYFWDPECGHCKKTTPKLAQKYVEKYWEKDVKVYSVYTQVDTAKWFKFIREHELNDVINVFDPLNSTKFRDHYDIYSTPVIYLLDRDKKIIAKRIDMESLESLLYHKLGIVTEKKEDEEAVDEETEDDAKKEDEVKEENNKKPKKKDKKSKKD